MAKKILVCDDDKDIVDMLKLVLSAGGDEVVGIVDSLTLYDTLDSYQPDVLLLDLWMPVLNGDEALKEIRADEQYKALPVVVMSANLDGAAVAYGAGATKFVAKPFDIYNIRRVILECVA